MISRAIELTEKKIKEAESHLAKGDEFHAKKSIEIAFSMAEKNMENEDCSSQDDYDLANSWQERMQAFVSLF